MIDVGVGHIDCDFALQGSFPPSCFHSSNYLEKFSKKSEGGVPLIALLL